MYVVECQQSGGTCKWQRYNKYTIQLLVRLPRSDFGTKSSGDLRNLLSKPFFLFSNGRV